MAQVMNKETISKIWINWMECCILCGKETNIHEELEKLKELCRDNDYGMYLVKQIFDQHYHKYRYLISINKIERI